MDRYFTEPQSFSAESCACPDNGCSAEPPAMVQRQQHFGKPMSVDSTAFESDDAASDNSDAVEVYPIMKAAAVDEPKIGRNEGTEKSIAPTDLLTGNVGTACKLVQTMQGRRQSFASESTQYTSEGFFSETVYDAFGWEADTTECPSEVGPKTGALSVESSFSSLPTVAEEKDLESVARQLAESTREACLKRLAGRSLAAEAPSVGASGKGLPTLLTASRQNTGPAKDDVADSSRHEDLALVSRQLAESTRDACLKRLARRGSGAEAPSKGPAGQGSPTLLTSSPKNDVAIISHREDLESESRQLAESARDACLQRLARRGGAAEAPSAPLPGPGGWPTLLAGSGKSCVAGGPRRGEDLESVSRQLAESTRDACLKRLAGRSGAVTAPGVGLAGRGLPTLLAATSPKDDANGPSREMSAFGRAATDAAELPVLLGARTKWMPQRKAHAEEDSASNKADDKQPKSLGSKAWAAFNARRRRISQCWQGRLAALVV